MIMEEIENLISYCKEINLDIPIWNIRTNNFYTKIRYKEVHRDEQFVYYQKKLMIA